jgi:hypothetical protein
MDDGIDTSSFWNVPRTDVNRVHPVPKLPGPEHGGGTSSTDPAKRVTTSHDHVDEAQELNLSERNSKGNVDL